MYLSNFSYTSFYSTFILFFFFFKNHNHRLKFKKKKNQTLLHTIISSE